MYPKIIQPIYLVKRKVCEVLGPHSRQKQLFFYEIKRQYGSSNKIYHRQILNPLKILAKIKFHLFITFEQNMLA
jgi:ribosomal protein L21